MLLADVLGMSRALLRFAGLATASQRGAISSHLDQFNSPVVSFDS
jgi:hypothetical protein